MLAAGPDRSFDVPLEQQNRFPKFGVQVRAREHSTNPARKVQRRYDAELHKERNRIERFFRKRKQLRRVAVRCDKLPANLPDCVKLGAIAIWFR